MDSFADRRCCEACTHGTDSPCAKLIACLHGGPLCHQDSACSTKTRAANASARMDACTAPVVFVGMGTCGLGAGAARTRDAIRAWLDERKVEAAIVDVGCIGLCSAEPLVEIQFPGRARLTFGCVADKDVPGLFEILFAGSVPLAGLIGQHRCAHAGMHPWPDVPYLDEHPFFAQQTRWVLENCGIIDPESIEAYLSRGGYSGFDTVLRERTPRELCSLVERSGLRGRGGGGFPTGTKWTHALLSDGDTKYLICNADEGDPGAFMDRAVIEGDPFRLLEGIAIASYAIGASKAYVYIRAEYPLAIKRLRSAIAQARDYGLLGHNILDSGRDLDIVVKMGAGAFVCGEETALIHSIEGRRGMPRPRPPYPAARGLFGKPTVINNVETLANLPLLAARGETWFSSVGTPCSKGTKVFALSGRVERTGLVEVAMGTTVRTIVFDIGGGIPGNKAFKAVQIGGPSGGCIPTEHLDIDIDYESLKTVGAMMGSGGLVVMDEQTCMVDVAKFFMDFIQRESCGKCIPCREGTGRMLDILNRITRARRSEEGLAALERFQGIMELTRLAEVIQDTSLCGLGQSAPNPVLSTLRWFKAEYEAHVFERKCPAHACRELLTYTIDPNKCHGCLLCARQCPSEAIRGAPKAPHFIVEEKCTGCGGCMDVCRLGAVHAA